MSILYDEKSRRLWLPPTIDLHNAQEVEYRLLEAANDEKPLELWCNSNGGNAHGGLQLARLIPMLPYAVVTIVTQNCASMAPLAFAAGDLRLMGKGSFLWFHQLQYNVEKVQWSADMMQALTEEHLMLDKQYWGLLGKLSKSSVEYLRTPHFKALSASESIEAGLADSGFDDIASLKERMTAVKKRK